MVSGRHYQQPPEAVLAAWGLAGARPSRLGNGLINQTWLVEHLSTRRVLQCVNPLFDPRINADIEAVTTYLAGQGCVTPRLVRTLDGQCWFDHDHGSWRLLSHIDGRAHPCLSGPQMGREAGALLGRYHRMLAGFDGALRSRRSGVHDTTRHLEALRAALASGQAHPDYAAIRALGERILAAAAELSPLPSGLPERLVHGDPKIDNILFSAHGEALCLVDLDTLGLMALPLELGDALRSWCNPRGEDREAGGFSLELFAAALGGYAVETRGWILEPEWRAIVPATETIFVELAARFCADAIHEGYFGWDPQRFASRSEHNRVRAAGQLASAQALQAVREEAMAVVADHFDRVASGSVR